MAVRNQNWYNLSESTPYPVEGNVASLLSDSGVPLPTHVICDLNLKFPDIYGQHAYIAACTVTPTVVSVVIFASESQLSPINLAPLAAVTIPQPVTRYRPYALDALAEGVGGWIVFGGGVTETFSGRFSSPAQSLLSPRAARAYTPLPVTGLGRYGSPALLSGVVRLSGGNDIEIVKETVEVPLSANSVETAARDVAVIRLKDKNPTSASRNVYDIYRGPCSGRPESNTCGDPQPIVSLGPVTPDCCGNITIQFDGCAVLSEVAQEVTIDQQGEIVRTDTACGVIIDCGFSLNANCQVQTTLPNSAGMLPGEVEDPCSVVSLNLEEWPDTTSYASYSLPDISVSEVSIAGCSWEGDGWYLTDSPTTILLTDDNWTTAAGLGEPTWESATGTVTLTHDTAIVCALPLGTACRVFRVWFTLLAETFTDSNRSFEVWFAGNSDLSRREYCDGYYYALSDHHNLGVNAGVLQLNTYLGISSTNPYNVLDWVSNGNNRFLAAGQSYMLKVSVGHADESGTVISSAELYNNSGTLLGSLPNFNLPEARPIIGNSDSAGEGYWAIRSYGASYRIQRVTIENCDAAPEATSTSIVNSENRELVDGRTYVTPDPFDIPITLDHWEATQNPNQFIQQSDPLNAVLNAVPINSSTTIDLLNDVGIVGRTFQLQFRYLANGNLTCNGMRLIALEFDIDYTYQLAILEQADCGELSNTRTMNPSSYVKWMRLGRYAPRFDILQNISGEGFSKTYGTGDLKRLTLNISRPDANNKVIITSSLFNITTNGAGLQYPALTQEIVVPNYVDAIGTGRMRVFAAKAAFELVQFVVENND